MPIFEKQFLFAHWIKEKSEKYEMVSELAKAVGWYTNPDHMLAIKKKEDRTLSVSDEQMDETMRILEAGEAREVVKEPIKKRKKMKK